MDDSALVIIPTYNEADNLRELVAAILDLDIGVQILVVDDNSPDGTGQLAEQLSRSWPEAVRVLHRPGKLGLGTAYCAGFEFGLDRAYRYFVTMDADFSHPPARLPALLAAASANDVVIGSRYVPGGQVVGSPFKRRLLSRGANLLAAFLLHLPARDCTAGFRCYRRHVLETVDFRGILSEGYSFLIEMLYHCQQAGFTICEVPITFRDRARGRSKISRIEIFKAFHTLLRLRTPLLPWRRLARIPAPRSSSCSGR
jgi:glycosyltransferase involved in cell wall biosynthesis